MRRLSNYLRRHRKRLGLSQDDVAHLLGVMRGTKVSRYEHFVRVPPLETALALEVILGIPVRDLFGGLYDKAEEEVVARAKGLSTPTGRKLDAAKKRRAERIREIVKRKGD